MVWIIKKFLSSTFLSDDTWSIPTNQLLKDFPLERWLIKEKCKNERRDGILVWKCISIDYRKVGSIFVAIVAIFAQNFTYNIEFW